MQEYLDKHELSRRVEEAINATVKDKPDEPLAFLVCAMSRLIWGQAGLPNAWRRLLTRSSDLYSAFQRYGIDRPREEPPHW